ncbi:MAG: uncharacterized membrane protein YhaH (DUF805 family) [Candidatus Midichloriaceae bacterium]
MSFKGRATRAEYWIWIIFSIIVGALMSLIDYYSDTYITGGLIGLYDTIFKLLIFLPSFTVGIRRFHDVNKSGWWILLSFTVIGLIPVIYWLYFCKSFPENNKYGPVPKL